MALQNGRVKPNATATAKCKVFKHSWHGHVVAERLPDTGKAVWIARLQCEECGTRRNDVMIPRTCELIGRHYDYTNAPSYDTKMEWLDAKKFLYKSLLQQSTVERSQEIAN